MFQIIFALIIIAIFLGRLFWQKKQQQITNNEFVFWMLFWSVAAVIIIFIKYLDVIVSKLGFSGSGIQILLYLAVATLFYFIFRIRLRIERLEQNITKLVELQSKEEFNKRHN
jgi:hypothetical protein